jgi:hypothetical protein
MPPKLVVSLVVGCILLVVYVGKAKMRKDASSPAGRLSRLIVQRPDYQIFVGVPFETPREWALATRQGEDSIQVPGYGTLRISGVRAFAVAYASGQLLDAEQCGLPLPKGLSGLSSASLTDSDVLRLDDLESGRAYVQMVYGPCATRPRDRNYYATTLTNISTERIRVHRFAGYRKCREGWKLFTVTGQFYSADEFREWYGLGSSVWIEPGQAVTDPNNYGSPPVLWAFYCESAFGKQFVAGTVLE